MARYGEGGGGPKTNGEKFMHSLSGPRARSREFLRATSAGWVYAGMGGWGRWGATALSPRLRPRAEYATWRWRRRRARAIARERKVIFHRRSWKTIPIVVMLKVPRLEGVLENLRNGIISLS